MALINDPIGDFLTRIRNAQLRQKSQVQIPSSKLLVAMAGILKDEGFITDYQVIEQKPQNTLELTLRYEEEANSQRKLPVIQQLKRISKPGVRRYVGYRDIPRVKNGLGISIVSTPQGVMKGEDAKNSKVGGELLCYIW